MVFELKDGTDRARDDARKLKTFFQIRPFTAYFKKRKSTHPYFVSLLNDARSRLCVALAQANVGNAPAAAMSLEIVLEELSNLQTQLDNEDWTEPFFPKEEVQS